RGSRAHGSKGSRDEFGNLYSIPHHDRIVEDDEEESTLMAAEILNKSLSINRSYSSIRSSFLMEPASYNIGNSGQGDDTSAGQNLTGVGSRLGSPVPGLGGGSGGQSSSSSSGARGGQHNASPMSSSNRARLYSPGQGHRGHRSSGSGSGSGGGSLLARGNNHSGNHIGQHGHRATSSNAGSNSSSIVITPGGWNSAGASNSGTASGHRAKASYDDLSLSSSDDDEDDDDSTDSDDEDYQSGGRYTSLFPSGAWRTASTTTAATSTAATVCDWTFAIEFTARIENWIATRIKEQFTARVDAGITGIQQGDGPYYF
ncbi:hypothetical protein BGZ82_005167, partial [Podila clonocystis]